MIALKGTPWALAALPALALARLLPETGIGLGLRLAAATAVLLLPGALLARAFGQRGAAATLAWSLAALFVALLAVFGLHTGLWLALVVLALIAAAALPLAFRRRRERADRGSGLVLLAGIGFGIALWHVAGQLGGDALFHLARVRKLDAFGDLELGSVNEFADGGLHPGYAFPLWHGFLALVGELGGVDPSAVVLHEATVLAPLAFLLAYEAGAAVFASAWGGAAVLLAQVAVIALAPGYGGAYVPLALPATSSRQLLVPAVVALFFAYVTRRDRLLLPPLAAASLALAIVHPTYVLFLGIALGGYALVRLAAERGAELREHALGLAAVAVPSGLFLLWLLPIVRDTASHEPDAQERRRALRHYAEQLDVFSDDRYRLAPEVFGRSGAVTVAALAAIPLAALAGRRRWGALVLGGALPIFALTLVSWLFPWLSDAVSLSQSRRLAGFVPFAFALAGGLFVLAHVLRWAVFPLALGAGIALQLAWPGDFEYGLAEGGPALATWLAVFGGAAAAAWLVVARRPESGVRRRWFGAAAAALFVVPVAVHGFANWDPRPRAGLTLSDGLVRAVRTKVPQGAIVFSDEETSYRIAALAPVYVAAAPTGHVADTKQNRPYERREDVRRFFRTGDLSIPRRYRARWLVVNRARHKLVLRLRPAYRDERWALYRL